MLASGESTIVFVQCLFEFTVAACFDAVGFAVASLLPVAAKSETTIVGATAGFGSSVAVRSREVVRLGGAVDPIKAAKTIGSVGCPGIEPAIARSELEAVEDVESIISITGWPEIDLATIEIGLVKVGLQAFAFDNLLKLNFVQRS